MKTILRHVFLLMGLCALLAPARAALNPGELGSTDESTPAPYGLDTGHQRRPTRDTAGNLTYPQAPTSQEAFEGALEATERSNMYNPDDPGFITAILRKSQASGREAQPFRPSVRRMVGTRLTTPNRVAATLVERQGPGAGGSDWSSLERILNQIFNGFDA